MYCSWVVALVLPFMGPVYNMRNGIRKMGASSYTDGGEKADDDKGTLGTVVTVGR